MKNIEDTNAVINIKNSQNFSDHDECIEITSAGKFYKKNGKFYILYKEYADIGEISVMIKAEGNKISVRRSGAGRAVMNYAENHAEEVLYRLPYGDIVLEMKTNSVYSMLNSDGGRIDIEYDIILNHEKYGNKMSIEIKKEN